MSRFLVVTVLIAALFGCAPNVVENSPETATSLPEPVSSQQISDIGLPSTIRKGQWYIKSDGGQIRFGDSGAEVQIKIPDWTGWHWNYLIRSEEGHFKMVIDRGDLDESVRRSAVARSGDLVTVLTNAPVESTENTISILWDGVDRSLLEALHPGANAHPRRYRIEDDGLRLVNIEYEDIVYVLR